MNALLHWLTTPEWTQLVKTLLHSLWQGALITVVLVVAMRRLTNPLSRYRCALAALAAIPVVAIITWATLTVPRSPQAESAPVFSSTTTALDRNAPDQTLVTRVVLPVNRPAPPPFRWSAWLALVWMIGAVAMLGRAGIKIAGAEQLRRASQPLQNPQIAQLVAEARRAVGLLRQVRVTVTDRITSPAVVGVLVPTLILPLTLVTTLTPEQIRFILLHELAHIRRGDYFANLFQLFVESLLFFNPAVWWISHQVRREREACCDALAIALSGAPADYARTLVHVAESILNPTPAAAPAFGNEREPSSLADRVQRLLVPGYRPSLRLTWRAMVTAFALGAMLLLLCAEGTRVVVAQIAKSNQEAPPSQGTPQSQLDGITTNGLVTLSPSPSVRTTLQPTSNADTNAATPAEVSIIGASSASQVEYNVAAQKTVVTYGGIARFKDLVVRADTIQFDQGTGKLIATGNVRVERPGHTNISSRIDLNIYRNQSPEQMRAARENSSSQPTTDTSQLFTRKFKVDPNTFGKALERVSPQPVSRTNLLTVVRSFFATLGVDLTPPKTVYYNDRSGELLVRSTAEDLDVIEAVLVTANQDTPQVNIKVRFVEVEREALGSDWYLRLIGRQPNATNPQPSTGNLTTGVSSNAGPQSFLGILTDAQYRAVLQALDQRQGLSLLSEGEVTTLSGRQAQLQVVELRTIVSAAVIEPDLELESLKKKAKEQDVAIEQAKADLANLRSQLHISDFDSGLSAPQPVVKSEEYKGYLAARFDREVVYKGRLEQLQRLTALSRNELREVLPGLEPDPTLTELINALNTADQTAKSLDQTVTQTHPEYLRVTEQRKLLNEKIDARVDGIMKQLEIQVATLKSEIDNLVKSIETARQLDQEHLTRTRPYYDKKRELEDLIYFRRLLTRKINLAEVDRQLPRSAAMPAESGNSTTNIASTNPYQAQTVPFGPVLDVTPTVSADGHTIQMTAIPTVTEFLGYDDANVVYPSSAKRSKKMEPLPLPRMRRRQASASAVVWDGQTLVLGIGNDQIITKHRDGGVQTGQNSDAQARQLLVFITPTIIDPTGNRVSPPTR